MLDEAVLVEDVLYLAYQKDVSTRLIVSDLKGRQMGSAVLPGKGNASWASQGPNKGPEQFFWFGSYTQPSLLYSFNRKSGEVAPFGESSLPFDPQSFETRQIFYGSKDGTRIPMFLIGRKGFEPNPNTPCLLSGYGGFNISLTAGYSPALSRVDRTGRHRRCSQPPRWRRVWRSLASGRHETKKAECLR